MSAAPNNQKSIWIRYWMAFGGAQRLFKDPYFGAAICLTIASFPLWITPGWWNSTINVMAILIGFSVSTFAVALSLTDSFRERLTKRDSYDDSSPLLTLIAGYIHYLTVGFCSVGASLISMAWYHPEWVGDIDYGYEFFPTGLWLLSRGFWILSGLLFCYSLTSALQCTMSLFRLADITQKVADANLKEQLRQQREMDTHPDCNDGVDQSRHH